MVACVQDAIYRHLKLLQGRWIPQLLAVGWYCTHMTAIVVTELIDCLPRATPLTSQDKLAALSGLRQLHDHGVLHCDVHRRNFLVCKVQPCCASGVVSANILPAAASMQACTCEHACAISSVKPPCCLTTASSYELLYCLLRKSC